MSFNCKKLFVYAVSLYTWGSKVGDISYYVRRSKGVQFVHLHPPGRWKKFIRRNLQGKCVSASPIQSKSQFLGHFSLGGLDLEVHSNRLLRATTKKRSSTFLTTKSEPPQTKSWLRLCIMSTQPKKWGSTPRPSASCTPDNNQKLLAWCTPSCGVADLGMFSMFGRTGAPTIFCCLKLHTFCVHIIMLCESLTKCRWWQHCYCACRVVWIQSGDSYIKEGPHIFFWTEPCLD